MKLKDYLGGGGSREPVPAGVYGLKIKGEQTQVKDAKNGGRQLSLLSTIVGGEYADRGVWQNFNLTEPGLYYLADFMQQIGMDPEETEIGDPLTEDDDWRAFLDSLDGIRYQAELTFEAVFSKAKGHDVDVNKIASAWPYDGEKMKGDVPQKAKEIFGPKSGVIGGPAKAKPAQAKPVGPTTRTAPRTATSKKDVPQWAKTEAQEGEVETGADEVPF